MWAAAAAASQSRTWCLRECDRNWDMVVEDNLLGKVDLEQGSCRQVRKDRCNVCCPSATQCAGSSWRLVRQHRERCDTVRRWLRNSLPLWVCSPMSRRTNGSRRAVVIALRGFRRGLEDCSLCRAMALVTSLVSWLCVPLHTLSMALLVHSGLATALLDCCLLCPSLLQSAPPAASKGSMHHKRKISILIASNSCVSCWMQEHNVKLQNPCNW